MTVNFPNSEKRHLKVFPLGSIRSIIQQVRSCDDPKTSTAMFRGEPVLSQNCLPVDHRIRILDNYVLTLDAPILSHCWNAKVKNKDDLYFIGGAVYIDFAGNVPYGTIPL